MTDVALRTRRRATSPSPRPGLFLVPPFHSTANPPVGLAYLVPHLARAGVESAVLDLNIEGRRFLHGHDVPGVAAATRVAVADSLFLQARRSYLGEALAWAWLDEGGRAAVAERVLGHPDPLLRDFWAGAGVDRLVADPDLAACADALRAWYDAVIRAVAASGAEWVGFSLTVSNQAAAFHAARLLRLERPDLLLVAGGPHVNPRNAASLMRACPALDAVVPGPAYEPLVAVLTQPRGTNGPVPGAWTRDGGRVVPPSAPAGAPAMDDLPFADWSIVDLARYDPSFDVGAAWGTDAPPDGRTVPLQTSRGCSYGKCEFCHNVVDHPAYLTRSPKVVADEVTAQVERTGARSFFFTDDEFNGSRRRTVEVARTLRDRDLGVRFFAWLRLDKVDTATLEELYEAGCRSVFIGVEAVDDDLLRLLDKGYGAEVALDRLRRLRAFADRHDDFRYTFNLIFGHPNEPPTAAPATLAAIRAEPELFAGRLTALCRYHVYEGTPAHARYGAGAVDCLDGVVPDGLPVDGFRLLVPDTVGDRLDAWLEVAALTSGGRRPGEDLAAAVYD